MKEVTLYGGTIDSCLKDLREMAAADESGGGIYTRLSASMV